MYQPSLLLFIEQPKTIIFIVLILVLFFGAKRIPELMRGLGQGVREFKDASTDANKAPQTHQPYAPPQPGYQPQQGGYQQPQAGYPVAGQPGYPQAPYPTQPPAAAYPEQPQAPYPGQPAPANRDASSQPLA